MPRPHLPTHLSLHRLKSHGDPASKDNAGNAITPATPPASNSRTASPARTPGPSTGKSYNGFSDSVQGEHNDVGLALRVTVIKARNLVARDKSGTSDPYLILSLGDTKEATSAVSKTLNPDWNQTFEFPVANADTALLEVTCWDKDRFRKDYMGEFDIILDELFINDTTVTEPMWFKLESRRSGRRKQKKELTVSGEVSLKFTLFDPLNTAASSHHVLQKFHGVVTDLQNAVAAEEGHPDRALEGTLSQTNSWELEDLDEDDEEDETDEGTRTPSTTAADTVRSKRRKKIKAIKLRNKRNTYEFGGMSDVAGVFFLEINRITDLPPEKNMTRTSFDMDPFVITSLGKKTYRTRVIRHNLNPVYDERLVFQVQKGEVNYSLNFAVVDRDKFSGNDFVAMTSLPLEKVTELAPVADPETGLYKLTDPDSIYRERRRRFRIPLSRGPSQNNVGRLSRTNSRTNLPAMSRTTSNSSLRNAGTPALKNEASFSNEPVARVPSSTSDPSSNTTKEAAGDQTAAHEHDEADLNAFELNLDLKNKARWEAKHNPVLFIKAKYLPYKALRQQFWRAMLRQYDADESGKMDKVEFVTMLDTLGSTLHNSTIDGFFKRFKQENGGEEVLTMDQAVICLEEQLQKTQDAQSSSSDWKSKVRAALKSEKQPNTTSIPSTTSSQHDVDPPVPYVKVDDLGESGERGEKLPREELASEDGDGDADLADPEGKEEHVVRILECPICHQPRLARGRKATDADIITHIATCASSDWRSVNTLIMSGFVTSSQAQRKWYSKVITKVCQSVMCVCLSPKLTTTGLIWWLSSRRKLSQYPGSRSRHWHD